MTTRILLVDTHRLWRDGVAALLQQRGFEIVGKAESGSCALELAHRTQPELILLDAALPGLNPLALTRRITEELPRTRVILLVESADHQLLLHAIQSGARGILLRDSDTGRFLDLIQDAAWGQTPLSAPLASGLFQYLASLLQQPIPHSANAGPTRLCPREREILGLVSQGMDNRHIATRLSLSENTIKYHLKNIFQKWHVHTRTQAVAHAVELGLLDLSSDYPPL